MKFFLLGLPASGKTTLGKALSELLSIPFIDLDREVEREEGMSIQKIFEQHSEAHFRKTENRILKNLGERAGDFVLSTGGGTPCFYDNMEIINRSGKSIFLDVPLTELSRRMQASDLSLRPLFVGTRPEGIQDKLAGMLQQRLPYYIKAQITFSGAEITPAQVLEKIRRESQT